MTRGRSSSDLKHQVESFLRTTLHQLDTVREVVVQKSRQGRIQLDLTLLRRRRRDALAELGATVVELAQAGRLREDDYPELSGPLAHLEQVDEKIADEERRARAAAAGVPDDDSAPPWAEGDHEAYDDSDLDDEDDGPSGRGGDEPGAR